MGNNVAIILSVFNGEKYLCEQIDSLINQTYKNIEIFIHDDGSTDNSLKIIKGYEAKYDNIHLVPGSNALGYPRCFIDLLNSVEGFSYYAFCDQDDSWLPERIEKGVNYLSNENSSIPLLYYSAVEYCNQDLKYIRESRFAHGKKEIMQMRLQDMLFGGEALGMTFLFNNRAREELIKANSSGEGYFKDWFLKLYCSIFGKVFYDPKPCAKYRRHSTAVTNSANPAGKINRYMGQITQVFFSSDGFNNQKSFICYINKNRYEIMDKKDEHLVQLFSEPSTYKKRMKKVLWPNRFRTKLLDEIGYRFAFLIGRM